MLIHIIDIILLEIYQKCLERKKGGKQILSTGLQTKIKTRYTKTSCKTSIKQQHWEISAQEAFLRFLSPPRLPFLFHLGFHRLHYPHLWSLSIPRKPPRVREGSIQSRECRTWSWPWCWTSKSKKRTDFRSSSKVSFNGWWRQGLYISLLLVLCPSLATWLVEATVCSHNFSYPNWHEGWVARERGSRPSCCLERSPHHYLCPASVTGDNPLLPFVMNSQSLYWQRAKTDDTYFLRQECRIFGTPSPSSPRTF